MDLLALSLIFAGVAVLALVLTLWLVPNPRRFDTQGKQRIGIDGPITVHIEEAVDSPIDFDRGVAVLRKARDADEWEVA